jgi:hypothetical protein
MNIAATLRAPPRESKARTKYYGTTSGSANPTHAFPPFFTQNRRIFGKIGEKVAKMG